MARGWESKGIESQIEEATSRRRPADQKVESETDRMRNRLLMDRTRILAEYQTACNARFRVQLERELAYVDGALKKLDA